ncbi:MAG: ABC-type transport auxiliary lipoprotein family protein [Sulfurimonas sp.]
MLKLSIAIFMMFVVTGCTVVKPHISEYRINPTLVSSSIKNEECSDKSLKVSQAFSSNALMLVDMNYAIGEYKSDNFTQSQWAQSPNRAITAHILKMLQEAKLFKTVQISKSRSKNGLILETNIEDFMQYFSVKKDSSIAKVVISSTLIDVKTNRVLQAKTFSKSIKVKSLNAEGGVIALNAALSEVLIMQREWLGEVCK